MEDGTTYTIVRFYERGDQPAETVETGLTLAEARAWCSDPETSSRTCTTARGIARKNLRGPWFEGYRAEE